MQLHVSRYFYITLVNILRSCLRFLLNCEYLICESISRFVCPHFFKIADFTAEQIYFIQTVLFFRYLIISAVVIA